MMVWSSTRPLDGGEMEVGFRALGNQRMCAGIGIDCRPACPSHLHQVVLWAPAR